MALFLTYYWVLIVDVAIYNYFGINYKVFLGFNHHFSTLAQMTKRASILTIIYLSIFVLYILQVEQLTIIAKDNSVHILTLSNSSWIQATHDIFQLSVTLFCFSTSLCLHRRNVTGKEGTGCTTCPTCRWLDIYSPKNQKWDSSFSWINFFHFTHLSEIWTTLFATTSTL